MPFLRDALQQRRNEHHDAGRTHPWNPDAWFLLCGAGWAQLKRHSRSMEREHWKQRWRKLTWALLANSAGRQTYTVFLNRPWIAMTPFFILSILVFCLGALSPAPVLTGGTPKGHLKPLGSHRPPDEPVVEYDDEKNPLSPERFMEDHVKAFRPAIIRGVAKKSPAFKRWTDEYLKTQYGDLIMRLEEKREAAPEPLPAGNLGIGRNTMEWFIDRYQDHSWQGYIVSDLPTPLYHEFFVPPPFSCTSLKDDVSEVNMWLSTEGAESKIHRDAFNSLNCLLNGTKEWYFMDSKYDREVYVVHNGKP